MGLLDGQLSKAIYSGFKGKLLAGTLRRVDPSGSGGLDELGDPIGTVPTTWSCEGFTEAYSDAFRAAAGIPLLDLKVNIFAKSLAAGVSPSKDDQVYMGGKWYQLRNIQTDPATALWSCQAFEVPAP